LPLSEDRLRRRSEAAREPAALVEARLRGLEAYQRSRLPARSTHLWRYTSPGALFPTASPFDAPPAPARELPAPPEGGALALVAPGQAPQVVLSDVAREGGLRVLPLADVPGLADHLGLAVPAEHGPLEALSLAAWNAGVAVVVPRGLALAGPVVLRLEANASTSAPRVLVLAGDDSEVVVIEEHLGGGEGASVVGVSELFAGPAARLTHALVQQWSPGTRAHLTSRLILERDAVGVTALAALGGNLVKVDAGASLVGAGARSEIVSLVAADGARHVDVHTVHDHLAGRTWSNVVAKVVLAGWARSVYTGLIRIAEQARGCEAFQENRNLMLSDAARADTIPELEILNDEVSCSHGATVGPLDDAQRFYLESRGLSPREAERLIVDGFFADALARLPEGARPLVTAAVVAAVSALRLEAE
jgi:Fe-S cluster assembly protein SufD